MSRSPVELEPEIEASRQVLARDVGALKEKAAPRRLLGEAVEKARDRGRRTGAQVLKTASSDRVWMSVVGGAILAGAAAWLLVSRRRAARRDTVAANLSRAAEPIGAILAGGAAWLLARRRWAARRNTVATIVARAAKPMGPLLRRTSSKKQGFRSFLTSPRS